MANIVVSVVLPLDVYIKLVKREISPSELKMVLQPVKSFEGIEPIPNRESIYKEISMPDWWGKWYKSLSRPKRLKFASIIQYRLEQMLKSA